jgi:hypothetical protein
MEIRYVPPTYPMLNLISSKGKPIAALLGLALALGGTGIGVMLNYWYLPPVAIVTGAVLTGILFSYVEIVRIILDTLVPR